jgi:peptidoglycan/LPS O-acetylase OafA/YrhL
MEKDNSISLLRVLAMLMVIMCHLTGFFGSWIAQVLNVGVYVFFIISGYLYSTKSLTSPGKWFFQRWEKICIPAIIWVAIVIVYELIVMSTAPSVKDVIIFGLNFQGLPWIAAFLPGIDETGALGGLTHLWFITVIMVCYLELIAIKKIEEKTVINNKIVLPVLIALCIILGLFRINIIPLTSFYIGYISGKDKSPITKKNYILLSAGMVAAMAARLIVRRYADGTAIYDLVTVHMTHAVLGLWIFHTVKLMTDSIQFVDDLAKSRFIAWCDKLSLFIYITHDYFLSEQFGLSDLVYRAPAQIILFFIISVLTAIGLKALTELITKRILPLINK